MVYMRSILLAFLSCVSIVYPLSSPTPNPFLKAAWLGAEVLGKAKFFQPTTSSYDVSPARQPATSAAQVIERLKADYDNFYFVTGAMDVDLYADDCTFGDPFASFQGRDRFVENLGNLGGFIKRAEIRPMAFDVVEKEPLRIRTKQMVKLQLALPWKPILAWPWGVDHLFRDNKGTLECVEHWESWDISAADGLKQVFRPGPAEALPNGFDIE